MSLTGTAYDVLVVLAIILVFMLTYSPPKCHFCGKPFRRGQSMVFVNPRNNIPAHQKCYAAAKAYKSQPRSSNSANLYQNRTLG